MSSIESLHGRALFLAKTFRETESSLLGVLMKLDADSGFLKLSYPSCFEYCRSALGLSEAQASYFSRVAKKSVEVPELKEAIDNGKLTVSQARRIVPVVNTENVGAWVDKAAMLPQRELEREVAEVNPKALPQERIRVLTGTKSELRVTISVEVEARLARTRDLLSKKRGKALTLEETLAAMTEIVLERLDPVAKAERAVTKARRVTAKADPFGFLKEASRRSGPSGVAP